MRRRERLSWVVDFERLATKFGLHSIGDEGLLSLILETHIKGFCHIEIRFHECFRAVLLLGCGKERLKLW